MKPFYDTVAVRSPAVQGRQDLSAYNSRRQGVEITDDKYLSEGIGKTTQGYFPNSQESPPLNLGQDSHWAIDTIGFSEDMPATPQQEYYQAIHESSVQGGIQSADLVNSSQLPTIDPVRFSEFLQPGLAFSEEGTGTAPVCGPFHEQTTGHGELMTSDMDTDYISARKTLRPSDDNAVPFGFFVFGSNGVPY